MPKITIELEVEDAQELASSAERLSSNIDWVLENKPPKQSQIAAMDLRSKQLIRAATTIKIYLNDRALANTVKTGGGK
jgi:hypothetical protein